jgi:hypothetical protein
MPDDLHPFLDDYSPLRDLAGRLGQFDPVQAEQHGPNDDTRPSIALWVIMAIVAAFVIALLVV